MKAVVAHRLGAPETLSFEEIAPAPVGPGDVRIRVHYAGVSFVDVLTAAGSYQVKPPTPFIPGSELSGVVTDVGRDVAGIAIGDRVAAGSFGNVFLEDAVLPATSVTPVPHGADMAEAAVVRSSYLTACHALKQRAEVRPGETVLVLGGGGAVGLASIQVARDYGAAVIGSASSEEKRALMLVNGARHAVSSTADDWRDQIMALTGGRGVDVVVDTLGGDHSERALRSLAWRGRHLVIGFAAGGIPRLPANIVLLKGAAILGVDLRQFGIHEPAAFREISDEVSRLVAAGKARPPIARVFPFEEYVEAMNAAAAGRSAGRIVLRMAAAG